MVSPAKRCAKCAKPLSKQRLRNKYCYSCERAVKKDQSTAAHRAMVTRVYGIAGWVYDKLLEIQGGRCAICQRAKGITRRLAVDHDHKCCKVTPACGKCVRGLLCKPCNRMLGHARDDPMFFLRAYHYLINPPGKKAELIAQDDSHTLSSDL